MTGYARIDGAVTIDRLAQDWTWAWELKSVNARGLDVRCRLSGGADWLEAQARKLISDRVTRGSVTAQFSFQSQESETVPRVNRKLLQDVMVLQEELEAEGAVFPSPPRLDVLLTVRGMVDAAEPEQLGPEDREPVAQVALDGLAQAMDQLIAMRAEEGRRLEAVLSDHLGTLDGLVDRANAIALDQVPALRERLRAQVAELLDASPALPEERLVQELAVIATKADVREEIERLRAHLAACRDLLASGEAVGRRLDFLCQELNREANTICSKSADMALTGAGLEMKATIEQFREQVQNVE